MRQKIRSLLEWWGRYGLRFHTVATPIGSMAVTLGLSQSKDVGVWDLEVVANFASAGILFYTASFAALEAGAGFIMVLAFHALEWYEAKKKKRQQDMRGEVTAMWQEAQRMSKETGEAAEIIFFEKLNSPDWQPTES